MTLLAFLRLSIFLVSFAGLSAAQDTTGALPRFRRHRPNNRLDDIMARQQRRRRALWGRGFLAASRGDRPTGGKPPRPLGASLMPTCGVEFALTPARCAGQQPRLPQRCVMQTVACGG